MRARRAQGQETGESALLATPLPKKQTFILLLWLFLAVIKGERLLSLSGCACMVYVCVCVCV